MKCPKCNKQAITMLQWMQKINGYKIQCNNCGAKLKANFVIILGFVLLILAILPLIPYLGDILIFLGIETELKKLELLLVLPIILFGAILIWFVGGYKEDKNS